MISKFLITLSGANSEILGLCPSERPKFQTLGWVMFISAVLATVSMWLMLTSEWGWASIDAFLAAVPWGVIVLGIDRWLVTSMPGDRLVKLTTAAPRLLLAMLLGTVVAVPVVLQIFQPQIAAEIAVIRQQQTNAFLIAQQKSALSQLINSWRNDVNQLNAIIVSHGEVVVDPGADPDIQSLEKQRAFEENLENQYYRQWTCQVDGGTGCSSAKGNGPLALVSEENYSNAKAQVNSLNGEIQQRQEQLEDASSASAATRYQQAVTALPNAKQQLQQDVDLEDQQLSAFEKENDANRGLLLDLQALSQLSNNNSAADITRFLVFLLILIIEALPVTVKFLQRPGIYEAILQEAADNELRNARSMIRIPDRAAPKGILDSTAPVQPQGADVMFDPGNTAREVLHGHAFISYVHEDSRHVDRLQQWLEEAGIPVWRDTARLWPGENWRVMIRRAITDDALVFIACFSSKSVARKQSFQNEELDLAIEQLRSRRPDVPWLIPVRFDECEIPDYNIGANRTLRSIQRADLFGKHAKDGAARLVEAVLRILGQDETSP